MKPAPAHLSTRLGRCLAGLLLLAMLCIAPGAHTQEAKYASDSAAGISPSGLPAVQADELLRSERFRHLASELRCLVCQNQTLADSNAELAADLRNEVLRQMALGKDDTQIKTHLVERFGEFVLYRPTFSAHNLALWIGPALLAVLGLLVLWQITRKRLVPGQQASLTASERAQIQRLLDQTSEPPADAPSERHTADSRARRG